MIKKIKEIYKYRELLSVFSKKELKVRYKNSALGFLWSFINPIIMAIVYTLVFGVLNKSPEKNFPLFLIIGLIPWNFFTTSIAVCTSSIMANSNLIKKVSFPREIVPLSIILSGLVNFLLEMVVVLIILLALGYNFTIYIPVFILAVFLQLIATIGFGFIFASLTVYFRDIEQLMPMLLLIWFFATPIVYNISLVSDKSSIAALLLKALNPMTSIILLYRESLLNLTWPSINLLSYASGSSLIVFVIGYFTFKKLSPNFAKEV